MHAFRLCARGRDRRQTLMLGMCMAIANVLATSYCNLAAPLVCLDLLGHEFLKRETRAGGRHKGRFCRSIFAKIGASPERCQRMAARCCREETWLVITNFARY